LQKGGTGSMGGRGVKQRKGKKFVGWSAGEWVSTQGRGDGDKTKGKAVKPAVPKKKLPKETTFG